MRGVSQVRARWVRLRGEEPDSSGRKNEGRMTKKQQGSEWDIRGTLWSDKLARKTNGMVGYAQWSVRQARSAGWLHATAPIIQKNFFFIPTPTKSHPTLTSTTHRLHTNRKNKKTKRMMRGVSQVDARWGVVDAVGKDSRGGGDEGDGVKKGKGDDGTTSKSR
jgi:hypothetical protein